MPHSGRSDRLTLRVSTCTGGRAASQLKRHSALLLRLVLLLYSFRGIGNFSPFSVGYVEGSDIMRLFWTALIAVVTLLILTQGTLADKKKPPPISDKMVRQDTNGVDFILNQFTSDVERWLKEPWNTDLGGHLDGAKSAAAEFKRELQAGKTWLSNVKTCDPNCK